MASIRPGVQSSAGYHADRNIDASPERAMAPWEALSHLGGVA